jgi:hypothetical protein
MIKSKTLLAAAILLGIAITGNSQAQTPTPAPAPADVVLAGSANALIAASNWAGLIALAEPFVTGSFTYAPRNMWTTTQRLGNLAIHLVTLGTIETQGPLAGHDYAAREGDFMAAADLSSGWLHNPAQAVVESGSAIGLSAPAHVEWVARNLFYQARAGQIGNAQITAFLKSQTAFISANAADSLYQAYNPVGASPADAEAFYGLFLGAVENTAQSAAFLGKVKSQLAKYK